MHVLTVKKLQIKNDWVAAKKEEQVEKKKRRGRGWEELGELGPVEAELSSARDAAAALLVREGS